MYFNVCKCSLLSVIFIKGKICTNVYFQSMNILTYYPTLDVEYLPRDNNF